MNESKRNESYVDMTVNSDQSFCVVYHNNKDIIPDINDNQINEYDHLKNVRSIYVNTPMPTEPMEVVPMIQL